MESIAQLALTALGSSAVTALITSVINRRKTRAETDNIIISMYDKLLEDMRTEIQRLQGEVEEMRKRETTFLENSTALMKKNMELTERVTSLELENKKLAKQIGEIKNEN